jgi:hypothetical protein
MTPNLHYLNNLSIMDFYVKKSVLYPKSLTFDAEINHVCLYGNGTTADRHSYTSRIILRHNVTSRVRPGNPINQTEPVDNIFRVPYVFAIKRFRIRNHDSVSSELKVRINSTNFHFEHIQLSYSVFNNHGRIQKMR